MYKQSCCSQFLFLNPFHFWLLPWALVFSHSISSENPFPSPWSNQFAILSDLSSFSDEETPFEFPNKITKISTETGPHFADEEDRSQSGPTFWPF